VARPLYMMTALAVILFSLAHSIAEQKRSKKFLLLFLDTR